MFDEDQLAYQIGETTEILSRGYLCATPHCVQVLLKPKFISITKHGFFAYILLYFCGKPVTNVLGFFYAIVSRHPTVKMLQMLTALLLPCSCNQIGTSKLSSSYRIYKSH